MSAISPVISALPSTTSFTEIEWNGQCLSVEYQLITPVQINTPEKIIFLHEGLGCVSMWKNFPEQLCRLVGMQGMVYSRPGYGKSSPLGNSPNWTADFMHLQAKEILPLILKSLNWLNAENSSEQKLHLLGHSDGASIAIIFAAQFPQLLSTLTVLAPHTKVENITLEGIQQAKLAYFNGNMLAALSKHHQNPQLCFESWSSIWLSEEFSTWNLAAELRQLQCPVLAIQGFQDAYGTMEQINEIQKLHSPTRLIQLQDCGHSPHKDQLQQVLQACSEFIA